MVNETKLTAQQRAALFAASTRQHFQMIGKQNVSGGAQTVEFRVPKARILQGVRLLVSYKATGATFANGFDPYKVLRRISIDLNNGFQPITCSGYEAALINTLYPHGEMVPADTEKKDIRLANIAEDGTVEFMLDMPLTLNYRDTSGLVLAQNQETSIDVRIDIDNPSAVGGSAYESFSVEAMTTTFSVPARSDWFPDLSILKVQDSRNETFTAGSAYIKLPTGMIYRKVILCFTDADGNPMDVDKITSNIELVLNTADTPYSISPKMLRKLNLMQSGVEMPTGVYFWSFDWQGIIGMGGSRDYIDAERVSEFSVRFNAAEAGKLTIISEKISRLVAAAE